MKLIKRKSEEELVCEQEGELYQEDTDFSNCYLMNLVNEKDQKIGDLSGRLIYMNKLMKHKNESDFFIEMDIISQLCCNVAEHILLNKTEYKHAKNICFLNRLSLDEEFISRENEEKALQLLFEQADVVIYSLGLTELDDRDFPERSDDYWEGYEKMLEECGWEYDPTYEFYIKHKANGV